MCVCGCPEPNPKHATVLMRFAVEMLKALEEVNKIHGTDIHIRVGINSGPVVAGVIGMSKVMYDLWVKDWALFSIEICLGTIS